MPNTEQLKFQEAIELRDYQKSFVDRVCALLFAGKKVLGQLPTQSGKTYCFSVIAQEFIKRNPDSSVLVVAHRRELIRQAHDKLSRITQEPVGMILAGVKPDPTARYQVASIGSIARRKDELGNPGLIIIDECFPAGSLVDNTPIESLRVGDLVSSYNEETGKVEKKPVVRLFKKLSNSKVLVSVCGSKIECTQEHPFYTKRGWIPANQLTKEDYLYVNNLSKLQNRIQAPDSSSDCVEREGNYPMLFEQLSKRVQITKSSPTCPQTMLGVFGGSFGNICLPASNKESVLLGRMPKEKICSRFVENDVSDKSQVCFSQNDRQQSYAQHGSSIESVRHTQKNWAQAIRTGREWQGCYSSTADTFRCVGECFEWLGDGISCQYQPKAGQWLSFSLQNRYCKSIGKNSDRDRWVFAHSDSKERARHEKNRTLEWVGVEGVEVFQQTGDGGSEERFVYNIEVLDNHNYFVEGVLVHNCHHCVTKSYQDIIDRFPHALLLGVTATPIRLDGVGFKEIFDELVNGEQTKELIVDGYLSSYRYFAAPEPMSTEGCGTKSGDFVVADIERVNDVVTLSANIIDSYRKHANGKQSIVFTVSVAFAHEIAKRFNSVGITAAVVHGKQSSKQRDLEVDKFKAKVTNVLVNCQLIDEGFSVPSVECVQIARPTKSLVRQLQSIGRGMAIEDGKSELIIIDHTQNYQRFGLPDLNRIWSLNGVSSDNIVLYRTADREIVEIKDSLVVVENEQVELIEIDRSRFLVLSDEDIELLATGKESGRCMAKRLGVGKLTISSTYTRQTGKSLPLKIQSLILSDKDIALIANGEESTAKVSERLSCCDTTVNAAYKRQTGKQPPLKCQLLVLSDEDIDLLASRKESVVNMAKRLGSTKKTIRLAYKRQTGNPLRSPKANKKSI